MSTFSSCNSPCCGDQVLFGIVRDTEQCARLERTGCISPSFVVVDKPIIIRAYGLIESECIILEEVGGCAGEYIRASKNGGCCTAKLNLKNDTLVVYLSGKYRLNRCVCTDANEPGSVVHVEYTYHEGPTPPSTCGCKGK